jgi:predicted RNA-binding Zn ribbon-like protein
MSSEREKRAFELIGGYPILDLVNTLDWRFRESGTEELLASYGDFLDFAMQSGIITQTEARRMQREPAASKDRALVVAREVREAAAEIFYPILDGRKPAAAPLAKLEALFKDALAHRVLATGGDGPQWEWAAIDAELPARKLALSAEGLLTSGQLARLRSCANLECRWLFLDTSKNHSRRWCEMSICGNRMKARRFKQQHRASVNP